MHPETIFHYTITIRGCQHSERTGEWPTGDFIRRFRRCYPKFLAELFSKSPRRSPQRAKLPQCSHSEEKRAWGKKPRRGSASHIHRSFAPLNAKSTNPNPYRKRPVSSTPAPRSRNCLQKNFFEKRVIFCRVQLFYYRRTSKTLIIKERVPWNKEKWQRSMTA